MTPWKKSSVIAGMIAVVLLVGQGCVQEDTTTDQSTDTGSPTAGNDTGTNTPDTSADDDYTKVACATGTKRYVSARANITFCYPERVGNETVTLEDSADDVKVRVGDEVVRVIAVERLDSGTDPEDAIMEYAAMPTDRTITCEVKEGQATGGRTEYTIVGMKGGQETAAATSACVGSQKLKTALDDESVGRFFVYDDEEELIIMSTSQDTALGQLTDEFESSIWPRE